MRPAALLSVCALLFGCDFLQAASCDPVDENGKSCIELIDKDTKKSSKQTIYTLTFKNSCDRTISVVGKRMIHMKLGDNGLSSTGVAPGGTAKITCVDTFGSETICRGFESWWPKCR